jgi:hypothetical protein
VSRKAYPRSVRWRLDYDYTAQLTPEERAWLERFNDRYYGATFTGDADGPEGEGWGEEERRAAFRQKNAANRDVYTRDLPSVHDVPFDVTPGYGRPDVDPDAPPEPPPAYLDTPEYKQARADFRALLDPHVDRGVAPTPEHERDLEQARRELQHHTKKGPQHE